MASNVAMVLSQYLAHSVSSTKALFSPASTLLPLPWVPLQYVWLPRQMSTR